MKKPICEVSGRALDYVVAVAEGRLQNGSLRVLPSGCIVPSLDGGGQPFRPTQGIAGDDIIDHEKIDTHYDGRIGEWVASLVHAGVMEVCVGITRREAAMRAFCASRGYNEPDIPKELL